MNSDDLRRWHGFGFYIYGYMGTRSSLLNIMISGLRQCFLSVEYVWPMDHDKYTHPKCLFACWLAIILYELLSQIHCGMCTHFTVYHLLDYLVGKYIRRGSIENCMDKKRWCPNEILTESIQSFCQAEDSLSDNRLLSW